MSLGSSASQQRFYPAAEVFPREQQVLYEPLREEAEEAEVEHPPLWDVREQEQEQEQEGRRTPTQPEGRGGRDNDSVFAAAVTRELSASAGVPRKESWEQQQRSAAGTPQRPGQQHEGPALIQ